MFLPLATSFEMARTMLCLALIRGRKDLVQIIEDGGCLPAGLPEGVYELRVVDIRKTKQILKDVKECHKGMRSKQKRVIGNLGAPTPTTQEPIHLRVSVAFKKLKATIDPARFGAEIDEVKEILEQTDEEWEILRPWVENCVIDGAIHGYFQKYLDLGEPI